MNDASFEKVSQSNKPLYGPRKLLLCGFSQSVQPKFSELVQLLGLSDIPRVWIIEDQAGISVGDLMQLEDNSGWGVSSELPRAIIMAGITQNELHRLMVGCRKAEMKPPLWATLTPTSETWAIEALLKELAAEHRAMQNKKRAE
ncbi:MAG: DUF3783 domain-containing protein [Deltaproteobacteria bacterium]|nr:DUF3783 domain-containing protein [Deltaproteobacteria bacterium]